MRSASSSGRSIFSQAAAVTRWFRRREWSNCRRTRGRPTRPPAGWRTSAIPPSAPITASATPISPGRWPTASARPTSSRRWAGPACSAFFGAAGLPRGDCRGRHRSHPEKPRRHALRLQPHPQSRRAEPGTRRRRSVSAPRRSPRRGVGVSRSDAAGRALPRPRHPPRARRQNRHPQPRHRQGVARRGGLEVPGAAAGAHAARTGPPGRHHPGAGRASPRAFPSPRT